MWKCSTKATFCGNFSTKPVIVEIFQPTKFLFGNFYKSKFLWKFLTMWRHLLQNFFLTKKNIFLEFFHKTARHLEGILRQKAWFLVKISAKSIKLPKFPRSNAATLQGFLWLWGGLHRLTKLSKPKFINKFWYGFSKHRPSGPMLSISRFVRVSVCLSVCLFTFEVPFNGLFCPHFPKLDVQYF